MPTDTPKAIITDDGEGLMVMLGSPMTTATSGEAAADTR